MGIVGVRKASVVHTAGLTSRHFLLVFLIFIQTSRMTELQLIPRCPSPKWIDLKRHLVKVDL